MAHFVNGVKLSDQTKEHFVCTTRAAVRRVFIGQSYSMREDALNLLGHCGAIVVTFVPRNGKPWRIKVEGCHKG